MKRFLRLEMKPEVGSNLSWHLERRDFKEVVAHGEVASVVGGDESYAALAVFGHQLFDQ